MDKTLRIMIVEDNPHARGALSAFISTLDWLTVTCEASNGEEAVEKIKSHGFDGYSNARDEWIESDPVYQKALAPDQGYRPYFVPKLLFTGKTGGGRCFFNQRLFRGRDDLHNSLCKWNCTKIGGQ